MTPEPRPDNQDSPSGAAELVRRMQGQLFWLAVLLGVAGATGYGVFFAMQGPRSLIWLEAGLILLIAGLGVWVRRTGRSDVGLGVIVVAVAVMLTAMMWLQGGIGAPTTWWLMVLPFVWMLSGALRAGLLLGLATIVMFLATPLVLAWLQPPDLLLGAGDPAVHHAASMTGALVVYGLVVAFALKLRKDLEARLMQALREVQASRDEAWTASQVKARFLATMSHEIRTPINGILGATELLRTTPLDARQQQVVGMQRQSLDSLMALVNDVLDYTRLESGKTHVDEAAADLRAMVVDVLELSAVQAHERGLELTCTVADAVPARVLTDPARLRQVLARLVAQAVRWTHQGGVHVQVDLSAPAADGAQMLALAVLDTGPGLPADALLSPAEALAHRDDGAPSDAGGVGLGLAICREVVHLMGGQITAGNRPDGGTCFEVMLPLKPAPHTPRSVAGGVPPGARVVLVASYHPLVLHVQHHLAGLGVDCEVRAVLPTLAELEQAGQHETLAVVVDERMLGGPGGRSWLERIGREAGLPVLLMCSMTSDSTFATRDGVFVLYKPVRMRSLADGLAWAAHAQPARAQAAARDLSPRPAAVLAGRVLLVEDNPVNQVMTQAMLERLGLAVVVAGDGREALERYGEQTFDMVLMDVQMPGMDGLTATRELRALEARAARPRTPVVAVTGNPEPEMRLRGQVAGMDDFLGKPFTLEQLEHMLLRWRPSLQPQQA